MRQARALVAALALLACGCLPAAAGAVASQHATLHATFTPDKLGASTTIGFEFHLSTPEGTPPPPLTRIDLHMPAGTNYTKTTLGTAICQPEAVLALGLAGCSPNSRLGYGSAYVGVPFGSAPVFEIPEVQALRGPSKNGNLAVLFFAYGQAPIQARLLFGGEVLPDSGRFGFQLAATVPPIPTVPGGPEVSVVSVHATIGPQRLTYYKHVHGKLVGYHPKGVGVPESCPRGGFPFYAEFSFQDGSQATASDAVPCPRRRG